MADEILDLIASGLDGDIRIGMSVNTQMYKKIRETKADWFRKECSEIEDYENRHDALHLHKKVKKVAGHRKISAQKNNK